MNEMRVLDTSGIRLYLNADERRAFLAAARQARPEVRTFSETLRYTGCRISMPRTRSTLGQPFFPLST